MSNEQTTEPPAAVRAARFGRCLGEVLHEPHDWGVLDYHCDGSPPHLARWRVESGLAVYALSGDGSDQDQLVGMMASPALAAHVVDLQNAAVRADVAAFEGSAVLEEPASGAAFDRDGVRWYRDEDGTWSLSDQVGGHTWAEVRDSLGPMTAAPARGTG